MLNIHKNLSDYWQKCRYSEHELILYTKWWYNTKCLGKYVYISILLVPRSILQGGKKMRQEELRAQNKQKVLEEALKCFYYDGIERTKVANVAQRAGVTSMSVYRYYGDKESIVIEAAMLFWNKMVDDMIAAIGAQDFDGLSGLDRLEKLLKLYMAMYRQNAQALILLQEFDMYMCKRKFADGRDRLSACYEKLAQPIKIAFEKGIGDGSIRGGIDNEVLCTTLLNALFGAMQKLATNSYALFTDKSCPAQRQMEICCAMAIDYLRAQN